MKLEWFSGVEPIMKEAGKHLLSYYCKDLVKRYKTEGGLVTDADLAVEEYLMEHLRQIEPNASFLTEESGSLGDQGSDWQWVIDPLDGTTNFAYGLPYFCISVALTYKQSPAMGVIYAPLEDKLFYAEKNQGAFLNGGGIRVSAPTGLKKALINVGVPYRRGDWGDLAPMVARIAQSAYAVRHFGAIALDLAHLAAGNLDGVLFFRLSWWDIAAGMLIVSEAGGKITDFKGNQLTPEYTSCVAASPGIYESLKGLVS